MRPEVFHVPFTNFPIDRVHSGRVNADENFARLWLGTRRVFVLEDLRSAVVVNSNRFHCSFFYQQRSVAHRALGKDHVSCLSITDRHAPPPAVERRHLRYLRRGAVFRETAHTPEQQGKFSSTTLIRSKPRVGFGTTRWPLMRRPSRASSGVISAVTKTIGTSRSAQSASSCVATSRPSACGMIRSTTTRSVLKLRAVSNARRGSFTAHAK